MFDGLEGALPDPILGLMDAFRADPRVDKVNLAVGVYQDEWGRTPVLESVKEAEKRLLANEVTKEYFSINGHPAFGKLIPPLILNDSGLAEQHASTTLQTPGGTGGLRVIADFLRDAAPQADVWLSDPTWPNHPGIFQAAGLKTKTYAYLDASRTEVGMDALLRSLEQAKRGDAVLLHGCCHNPTGVDLSIAAWQAITKLIVTKDLLPIVDLAYLGFADGLREDVIPMRTLFASVPSGFICMSFSKNFGLYRDRVGAITYFASSTREAETVASRIKRCVRVNYSNPPGHGGSIVATILEDAALRSQWEQEVSAMRVRLKSLRAEFTEVLGQTQFPRPIADLSKQKGMFSILDLSPLQVDRLRTEHGIYMVRNGRVNFAGMRTQNMAGIAKAIADVAQGSP